MGAQFIHQNTYSMELTAGSKKENANTVASVLGEGMRLAGNCPHVEKPQDPITIFGDMNNIVPACEKWLAETKDPTGKKMRKDANCLIGGVVSCSPEDAYKWPDIRDESLKYLQKKFGDRLIAVIEHVDEPFDAEGEWYDGMTQNHMHYYVVPLPGEALENIHEGKKAVASVKKAWNEKLKQYSEKPELIPVSLLGKLSEKFPSTKGGMGALAPKELLKTLKKVSNASEEMRAYKTAMRGFQSDYYFNVGMKMGLTRTGPKRMRLTRAENNARKEEARKNADLIIQVKELAYEEGKRIGLLNGFDEGFEQGKTIGIEQGKEIGIEVGKSEIKQNEDAKYTQAFNKGYEEGKSKFNKQLAKNPITKIGKLTGGFAVGVKRAWAKNPLIDKIKSDFNSQIDKIKKELNSRIDDLDTQLKGEQKKTKKLNEDLLKKKTENENLQEDIKKLEEVNSKNNQYIEWLQNAMGIKKKKPKNE